MCCPSSSGNHWSSAAPSRRTLPRQPHADQHAGERRLAGGTRADAARPMPAFSSRETSCTAKRWLWEHRIPHPRPSARPAEPEAGAGGPRNRHPRGTCEAAPSPGALRRSPSSWRWRASTGASARETRIEEAIMMPPVASLWMTRVGADAEHADCSVMRITFEKARRDRPTRPRPAADA